MRKYKVIYADPPWKFSNTNTGGSMKSGAQAQYSTMSLDELKKLRIDKISQDNCVLVMWWVASQPKEAIELAESWGFTIKTMTGFVWVKKTKHFKPFFGMGFWTRAGAECALIAVKGKPKPQSHGVRSVREAVTGRHSEKPEEFRDDIDILFGECRKIELFAKEYVPDPNWDVWGDEVVSDINLE
jgi:N6-adenosine-specific RNA methylase IME4